MILIFLDLNNGYGEIHKRRFLHFKTWMRIEFCFLVKRIDRSLKNRFALNRNSNPFSLVTQVS